jgi:hypothetical protein
MIGNSTRAIRVGNKPSYANCANTPLSKAIGNRKKNPASNAVISFCPFPTICRRLSRRFATIKPSKNGRTWEKA